MTTATAAAETPGSDVYPALNQPLAVVRVIPNPMRSPDQGHQAPDCLGEAATTPLAAPSAADPRLRLRAAQDLARATRELCRKLAAELKDE